MTKLNMKKLLSLLLVLSTPCLSQGQITLDANDGATTQQMAPPPEPTYSPAAKCYDFNAYECVMGIVDRDVCCDAEAPFCDDSRVVCQKVKGPKTSTGTNATTTATATSGTEATTSVPVSTATLTTMSTSTSSVLTSTSTLTATGNETTTEYTTRTRSTSTTTETETSSATETVSTSTSEALAQPTAVAGLGVLGLMGLVAAIVV